MKIFKQITMGLLTLLLCAALPSCSDDDNEINDEETQQEIEQGVLDLLNLKMNLCRVNLKGEPTEATLGIALSESNTAERIYYIKDLASAKKRYQLLFHKDTKCSSDGNTYTLANNQGSATFAAGSGNKGELAVATFDVPGLKGLVTKVHFIDYTQRGENSSEEQFAKLAPGKIVNTYLSEGYGYAIAMGPLKGSNDTYILFAPSIEKNRGINRSTGYINHAMYTDGIDIDFMDYIKSYSEEEYYALFSSIERLLFDRNIIPDPDYLSTLEGYGNWDWIWDKSYYLQVNGEYFDCELTFYDTGDFEFTQTLNRNHMRISDQNYDSRTNLWVSCATINYDNTTIEPEPPQEYKQALPILTYIYAVTKWDYLQFYDY